MMDQSVTVVESTTVDVDVSDDAAAAENGSGHELYVVCTMLAVFAVLGSAGNGLVLYVFTRRRDRLVSTLYIQVLAVVDLFASLVLMPFTAYMEYVDFHIASDVVCKFYLFLITSNIPFSALIMVAIAIDRFDCFLVCLRLYTSPARLVSVYSHLCP